MNKNTDNTNQSHKAKDYRNSNLDELPKEPESISHRTPKDDLKVFQNFRKREFAKPTKEDDSIIFSTGRAFLGTFRKMAKVIIIIFLLMILIPLILTFTQKHFGRPFETAILPTHHGIVFTDDWHRGGTYRINENMSGEYIVATDSKRSCSISVTTNGAEELNYYDALNSFRYITLEKGQKLRVSDGRFARVENVEPLAIINYPFDNGMYLVGRDITEGKYTLMPFPTDNNGYYQISSSSHINDDYVVEYEHFQEEIEITVEDGQYVIFQDCSVNQV